MAIEDILRALDEECDAEVAAILDAARARAAQIEAAARAAAERTVAEHVELAGHAAERDATSLVGAARRRERHAIAEADAGVVERVFALAADELRALPDTSAYPEVFRRLADEALAGVEGPCELRVAEQDAARGADYARDVPGLEVQAVLPAAGGVVVALAGGRVLRRNTFESRLAKMQEIGRDEVLEVLGG